jgi:glucan 1,3-beta-glucosidase
MTASEGNNGVTGSQGDASIANLQIFLDTFVCQANANGTDYFFCKLRSLSRVRKHVY